MNLGLAMCFQLLLSSAMASWLFNYASYIQQLFTTDRTPSTLQDQELFKSYWQVIRNYSSL
jgi:hypothetical protein